MVENTKKSPTGTAQGADSADNGAVIVIGADRASSIAQDAGYGIAYLEEYTSSEDFISILAARGIRLLTDDCEKIIHGGNGIIYRCLDEDNSENGTVLKVTSSRKSGTEVQELEDGKDFCQEGCVYYLFDDDTRKKLVRPFRIKLVDGENNTVDYINCYHFPLYKELGYALNKHAQPSKPEKEKAILGVIRDILTYIGNNQNIRHRDIKPGNIMYDSKKRKFVLIDWGDALLNLPVSASDISDKAAASKAFTDYYVDPRRLECAPEDALAIEHDFRIDLYSLGVVMAYLAHPDGWYEKNDISHTLASETREIDGLKYHVVAKGELMSSLSDSTLSYRNIVKKALSHSYAGIDEMVADVDKLISESGNMRSFAGLRKIHPFWGLGIAAIIFVISFISSGYEGLVASMFTGKTPVPSYLLLIICALLPTGLSIFKISRTKDNELPDLHIYVTNMELLGVIAVFAVVTAVTNYFLGELNMKLTLDVVSALFIFSVIFPALASAISRGKNFSLLRLLICGAFLGFGVGICIAGCISTGGSYEIVSSEFGLLVAELVALGAVLGVCINLFALLVQSYSTGIKN